VALDGLGRDCQEDLPSDWTDDEPGSDPDPDPQGDALLFDPPPPPMESFVGESEAAATVENLQELGEFMKHFQYSRRIPKLLQPSPTPPTHSNSRADGP